MFFNVPKYGSCQNAIESDLFEWKLQINFSFIIYEWNRTIKSFTILETI